MRQNFDVRGVRICRVMGMEDVHKYNSWKICERYISRFRGIVPVGPNSLNIYTSVTVYPADFSSLPIHFMSTFNLGPSNVLLQIPSSLKKLIMCDHNQPLPSTLHPSLASITCNGVDFDVALLKERRSKGLDDFNKYNHTAVCLKYLSDYPYVRTFYRPPNSKSPNLKQQSETETDREKKEGLTLICVELCEKTGSVLFDVPRDFHLLPIGTIRSYAICNVLPDQLATRLEQLVLTNKVMTPIPWDYLPQTLTKLVLKKYTLDLPRLPVGLRHLDLQGYKTVAFEGPKSLEYLSYHYGEYPLSYGFDGLAEKEKSRYNCWKLCREYLTGIHDNVVIQCPGSISISISVDDAEGEKMFLKNPPEGNKTASPKKMHTFPADIGLLPISSLDVVVDNHSCKDTSTHPPTVDFIIPDSCKELVVTYSTQSNATLSLGTENITSVKMDADSTLLPEDMLLMRIECNISKISRFPSGLIDLYLAHLEGELPPILPRNLETFRCGYFAGTLPRLPDSLKTLVLEEYDSTIYFLPSSIKNLTLTKFNKHPLVMLPDSIVYLNLQRYNHPLCNIPKRLCHLQLGDFNHHFPGSFPDCLQSISLENFSKTLFSLPSALTFLHAPKSATAAQE